MTICEYSRDQLMALLPLPDRDANKYTRGKLTAVVGSARYPGAACLAAAASQRMGAGYTEVVTDPSAVGVVRAFRPSLVVRSWDGWKPADSAIAPAHGVGSGAAFAASSASACGSGSDADSSFDFDHDSDRDPVLDHDSDLDRGSDPGRDLDHDPDPGRDSDHDPDHDHEPVPHLDSLFTAVHPGKPHAYAVGAGFDAEDQKAVSLVHLVLKQATVPVLVDGGGLGALATKKGQRLLKRRFILGRPTVVTPHAGEASRLAGVFGFPTDDPAELSRLISLAFGVVAVVKGPNTFVSDGDRTVLMAEGTPSLAKTGTGDVLAGMIGALLAQGIAPVDAAVLGATLHARAGCEAAERFTPISVIAEDVLDAIPAAIAGLVSSADA